MNKTIDIAGTSQAPTSTIKKSRKGERRVLSRGKTRAISNEGQKDFLVQQALEFEQQVLDNLTNTKPRAFEQIDKLYKSKIKTIDHSLGGMYDYLKPQAPSIYFERKVEFGNLVNDKKKVDARKKELANDQKDTATEKKESAFEKNTAELRQLMSQFDIKHPLRGEGYEDLATLSQPFHHKIQNIVAGPNSYMGYKKDLRVTLDFSAIRSESYLKEEQSKFQKQRIIMKYRLYGREGVTEREYNKLIEWKIVKLKQGDEGRRQVRVKKRVKKTRVAEDQTTIWYSTDDSRSCDSAYTTKLRFDYEDNETGDPIWVNNGFQIQPLDSVIYGNKAARESRARKATKKPLYPSLSTRNHQGGRAQYHTQAPSGSGANSTKVRTPLQIPELNIKGDNGDPLSTKSKGDVAIDQKGKKAIRDHKMAMTLHQGSKTETLQFTKPSNASLGSGAIEHEGHQSTRGGSQINGQVNRNRKRILMPHLVNKYAIVGSGHGIDEGSEDGRYSPKINRNPHETPALGFSFGGESVDQLDANETQMTGSSRHTLAGYPLKANSKMGRAEFIIDKKSGAKFKYSNNDDINPDMLRGFGGNQVGQSVRIQHRAAAGPQGGSALSYQGLGGTGVQASHDMLYQTARGHSMLAPGSTRRGQKIKHPHNMSQLSEYTVKVKTDTREAGSPFRFKAIKDVKMKSNLERKTLGEGRMNKQFTERTPKLGDQDIRSLISKYPVEDVAPRQQEEEVKMKEEEEARKKRNILAQMSESQLFKNIYGAKGVRQEGAKPASKYETQIESNKQRKRELEFLGRNIDKMERQSKAHYKDLLTKLVIQNFRDEELAKISEVVKELEFAQADAIPNLYKHRIKDEEEKQKVVIEVTKEHQDGKLDPTKFITRSKNQRKKK